MNLKPIHGEEELNAAFARLEYLWGANAGSPESEELKALSILIEKYEDEHYPIGPSAPSNPGWNRKAWPV